MGQCKKDVTALLMHWSYVVLALTHVCTALCCVVCPIMLAVNKDMNKILETAAKMAANSLFCKIVLGRTVIVLNEGQIWILLWVEMSG